jgi:AraC-like DNA-binding protein
METICLPEGNNFGELKKKDAIDMAWLSLTTYGATDSYPKHYHENPYLSLLVAGAYNEKNKSGNAIINNGEIIYRPANYDHSNDFCGTEGTCFNIEFKKDWKAQLDFDFKLPPDWHIYKCGTFTFIYKLLTEFKLHQNSAHLSELIVNWFFEYNDSKLPESNIPWIQKVKTLLNNEPEIAHTMESVAERVFVHPIYMAGCFKKKTGLTIGEYHLQSRIKKADYLLFNSKKSISEIAFECGFYDASHFIKNYQSIYKISPAKFRKNVIS